MHDHSEERVNVSDPRLAVLAKVIVVDVIACIQCVGSEAGAVVPDVAKMQM
jgi:hypothetical protein